MRWLILGLVLGCAAGGRRVISRDAGPQPDVSTVRDAGSDTLVPRDGALPDASRPDTALPSTCSSNPDCQDSSACNGSELCIGSTCMRGTAVGCDDGIPCTVDACTEPAGSCTHTPDSSLCAPGQTCIATGCTSGGPTCAESPCKVISPQCGCPVSEGCYIDADGNAGCAAIGAAGEGAACSMVSDCAPGLSCIGIGGGAAACHKLCTIDSHCSTGSICIIGLEDTMMRPLAVSACTIPCNPAAQTGCPAGASCFLGSETAAPMRSLTHCDGAPSGTRGQGVSCASEADCQAAFSCLAPDTFSIQQCLHLCRNPTTSPGPSADCPGAFEDCYGFDPPLSVGFTTYGVCWNGI